VHQGQVHRPLAALVVGADLRRDALDRVVDGLLVEEAFGILQREQKFRCSFQATTEPGPVKRERASS
jgi:hypothetical protein